MKLSVPTIIKSGLILLLVLCLFDMPYGFYEFVRFTAFAGFGYLAYKEYEKGSKDIIILYIILSILFQPFIKLALGRVMWNIIDVAVSLFLIYSIYTHLKTKES